MGADANRPMRWAVSAIVLMVALLNLGLIALTLAGA